MKIIFCSSSMIDRITQEIQILKDLENEFISAYVDSFSDGGFYCILTEYYQVNFS